MRGVGSAQELLERMADAGGGAYFGEPVTVLEHSLQAAWFAQRGGNEPAQVVAALLHDVGHLLHEAGEDAAEHGVDTRHEETAVELLREHLPAAVTEPIRLHVAAKRFLCCVDSNYLARLSPASVLSLELQGGPMTAEEAAEFAANRYSGEAVALRHWDDAAKVPGLAVPELGTYLPLVAELWRG